MLPIHGLSGDRLHNIWKKMRSRCNNPKDYNYAWYGGVGVTVCEEWDSFVKFKTWAEANGYASNLTLDRIDCRGRYEPINCRWTTLVEQSRNRTVNVLDEEAVGAIRWLFLNTEVSQKEIAECFQVSKQHISAIKCGKRWAGVLPHLTKKTSAKLLQQKWFSIKNSHLDNGFDGSPRHHNPDLQ